MKKIIFIVVAGLVLLIADYAFSEQPITMPASPAPALLELIGTTDQTTEPVLYPEFYAYTSDNPECGEYLKKPYANGGFSLAPRWVKSKYEKKAALPSEPDFVLLDGLKKVDFSVPANYRNTSKLLFTWTVRIEAVLPQPVLFSARTLCGGKWIGTSYLRFKAGEVKTQLFINGRPMGQPALMTVPDAGNVAKREPPPDPTLTGSCLVTKEAFGGSFPDKMTVELRWKNASCMKLKSLKNMRNLIIATVPITTR